MNILITYATLFFGAILTYIFGWIFACIVDHRPIRTILNDGDYNIITIVFFGIFVDMAVYALFSMIWL